MLLETTQTGALVSSGVVGNAGEFQTVVGCHSALPHTAKRRGPPEAIPFPCLPKPCRVVTSGAQPRPAKPALISLSLRRD
jgi:hypothetical protein